MTDSTPAGATPASAPASAPADNNLVFNFEKVYIKDMSIEVPHAPQIFLESAAPTMETSLNINAANFADGMYEVTVTATVTTRTNDKVMFLVEVAQAGIFEMRNFSPEQLENSLGIYCAAQVYPYLRSTVADVITRAGFPVLHLPTVNFEVFYAQRMEQLRAAQAKGEPGPPEWNLTKPGLQ